MQAVECKFRGSNLTGSLMAGHEADMSYDHHKLHGAIYTHRSGATLLGGCACPSRGRVLSSSIAGITREGFRKSLFTQRWSYV